jgi:putative tricarboxylic transport membrane protein
MSASRSQTLIGGGTVLLALLLAAGASQIHGEAGYAGVGPAFLPWLVSAALAVCGVLLMIGSLRPGDPAAPERPPQDAPASDSAAAAADWRSMAWISAGLLLNAALISRLGFVLSCALLFALAARGFRRSMGQPAGLRLLGRDALIGLALSAPVYWLFTKGLGLTLPGLTKTGWL